MPSKSMFIVHALHPMAISYRCGESMRKAEKGFQSDFAREP
jgi:hypothetical protein